MHGQGGVHYLEILAMSGACCEICGSLSFEPFDGLFFCLDCGTQSQDVREEVTEESIEPLSFVRTLKAPSTKKKAATESKTNREITLLEKMQVIIKLQCDALINLGYDKSLKEAVKYIWFLYLKQFGYAFQDSPSTSQSATPTSLTTPTTPGLSCPQKRKRPEKRERGGKNVPTPKRPEVGKKKVHSSDAGKEKLLEPSPPRKRSRVEQEGGGKSILTPKVDKNDISLLGAGKGKSRAEASNEILNDSFLFKEESDEDSDSVEEEGPSSPAECEGEASVSGNDLYMLRRAKRRQKVKYFSLKYTIGLLYLGLLYTHQRILPADLMRLVALHKIPYYNLHTVLPQHFITAKHSTSLYARTQITTNKIHQLSQELYKSVPPLPTLPPGDPEWVCHTLLERLQLPQAFQRMVENALRGVYWPQGRRLMESSLDLSRWKDKRLDVECMALIVCVVKMIYRLDDEYEFEQASRAVSGEEASGSDSGEYVYVWQDWVTVFCRHMQQALDKGIPLNARELEYVSDYKNFLDFCREEVFPKVRPKERPGDQGRRRRFHPEYFRRISDVFRQHRQNLQEREAREKATDDKRVGMYSWDSFVPRQIPLSALLGDSDHAPWRKYVATPTTSKDPREDLKRLPGSMVLLLELCCDVVDTSTLDLMQQVRSVEWHIIKQFKDGEK